MRKRLLPVAILSSLFALTSLTGCNEEEFANLKNDFQTQIDEIKEEINEIKTKITTLRMEMTASIETVKSDYQAQIDGLSSELEDLQAELEALEAKHDEDKAALEADYNSKLNALTTSFTTSVNELNASITANQTAITNLTNKHDQDIQIVTNAYLAKIEELKKLDADARAVLNESLSNSISALDAEFELALEELNGSVTTNSTAISNLTTKLAQDILDVTSAYEAAVSELGEDEEEARALLEKKLEEDLTTLNTEFEAALAELQSDVEANEEAIEALTEKHNQDIATVTSAYEAAVASLSESETAARAELKQELETSISNLNAKYESDFADLQSEVSANADAISTLTTKHNQDIATLTSNYETAISNLATSEETARVELKAELEAEISALDTAFEEQVAALQTSISTNSTAIANLTTQFNNDKIAIQNDYNSKITALEDKYATKVNEINTSISSLQAALTTAINEMNTKITNIQSDYQSQINDLTSRVGVLEEVQTHTVSYYIYCNYDMELLTTEEVIHGEKANRPDLPDSPGYEYSGEWLAIDSYHMVTEKWSFLGSVVTENMNLYQVKSPLSYVITLDENYSEAPAPYEKSGYVYSGQSFTCPIPSRANYSFSGWYYGDTQVTDAAGNSLLTYEFASDITLKAKWVEARDGLTPGTAFNTEEAITLMDIYGDGNIVSGNVEYYVIGKVSNSKYNTKYGEWSCNLGSPTSEGKQFVVTGAHLSDGTGISNVDGALDGAIIVVKGFLELYQGVYKAGFLPANVSPTGAKYYPTLLI